MYSPAPSLFARRVDLGLLVLRVVLGATFIAHGYQKLFGMGFDGVSGAFAQMGAPLPGVTGPLISLIEFFGGFAILLGLFTRLAGLGLVADMLGAILIVHLPNGFFAPMGMEFPLLLGTAALTLVLTGAGAYSLDALIAERRTTGNRVTARAV